MAVLTAGELTQALAVHDDDKPVITLGIGEDGAPDKPFEVTGVDSYEDALVLVTQERE